jgi:hypothetical protein
MTSQISRFLEKRKGSLAAREARSHFVVKDYKFRLDPCTHDCLTGLVRRL